MTSQGTVLPTLMACMLALGLSACADDGDSTGDSDGTGGDSGSEGTGGSMSAGSTAPATSSTPEDTGGSDGADGTGDSGSDGPGDTGSDGADTSGDTAGDTSGDTTTGGGILEVVESDPADGEAGVTEDAAIVVRFSQPMNKAATQVAYQSADIPAAEVTFSWNAASDEMTVTPNALLPYAIGDDPSTLQAEAFTFSITTAAESADGTPLPEEYTATFTTLRRFLQYIDNDAFLTGKTTDLGDKGVTPYMGDHADNDPSRYFVTFDLSGLAPDIVDVEAAEFSAGYLPGPIGNPFTDLGGLAYQQVAYDTFSQDLFDTPGIGSDALILGPNTTSNDVDVVPELSDVIADPATFEDRLQFRLFWFPFESDGNGDLDGVTMDSTQFEVGVLYLAP